MSTENILELLADVVSEKNIIKNCDMSRFTSFQAGGRAYALVSPENTAQLKKILSILSRRDFPYTVIGNGTNILVTDKGYKGVMIKIGEAFSDISIEGEELTAEAGVLLALISKKAMEAGLSGLEFASGIPGSLGGALFMNAGAYGSEMKNVVKCVNIISGDGQKESVLTAGELDFCYRRSILQSTEDIVVSAVLKLSYGDKGEIDKRMQELRVQRNQKQPVSKPSAGSFFKRPHGQFAGQLIEEAGLKELTVGGATVSEKHAGFIVNNGGATAKDVIDLMNIIVLTVRDRFGITLEPEVRIIGDI